MADTLSAKIREARNDAGLTQEQMAPKIGVTLRTLSRYESGDTDRISVQMVMAIGRVTGKPLSFFVTTDDPQVAA